MDRLGCTPAYKFKRSINYRARPNDIESVIRVRRILVSHALVGGFEQACATHFRRINGESRRGKVLPPLEWVLGPWFESNACRPVSLTHSGLCY